MWPVHSNDGQGAECAHRAAVNPGREPGTIALFGKVVENRCVARGHENAVAPPPGDPLALIARQGTCVAVCLSPIGAYFFVLYYVSLVTYSDCFFLPFAHSVLLVTQLWRKDTEFAPEDLALF
jgi:hypothetical protein